MFEKMQAKKCFFQNLMKNNEIGKNLTQFPLTVAMRNYTVHSGNNGSRVEESTELSYYPNHYIFMHHIRPLPTNLPQKSIWPISADQQNIWIFNFFVFFSFEIWYHPNFEGEKNKKN